MTFSVSLLPICNMGTKRYQVRTCDLETISRGYMAKNEITTSFKDEVGVGVNVSLLLP